MSKIVLFIASVFFTALASADDVRKGDIVYGNNGFNLVGIVHRVDGENARVKWLTIGGDGVDQTHYIPTWPKDRLSRSVRCIQSIQKLCSGDEVSGSQYGNKYAGKIKRIFSNGKTEVYWMEKNGIENYTPYTRLAYWESHDLRKNAD